MLYICCMKNLILLILLIFFSCKNGNYNNDIDTVEIFGDSLRIETRIEGNEITKYYIDLQGTADDGFDNSFVVNIIVEAIETPLFECQNEVPFLYDNFEFVFCQNQLIEFLKGDSKFASTIEVIQKDNFKGIKLKEHKRFPLSWINELEYEIRARNTGQKIILILIENYTTSFNSGRDYLGITEENDTITLFQFEGWMK